MTKFFLIFALPLAVVLSFSGCAGTGKAVGTSVLPEAGTQVGPSAVRAVPAPDGKKRRTLFVIERSMNSNVVHYDAQLTADGKLDPKEPVVAYWIMSAEDGRTADLTMVERFRNNATKRTDRIRR